jgi:hypothetical protein
MQFTCVYNAPIEIVHEMIQVGGRHLFMLQDIDNHTALQYAQH